MNTRRQFIKKTGIISLGLLGGQTFTSKSLELNNNAVQGNGGFAISTWKSGLKANEAAWEIISKGGRALDAVEAGVKVIEADPEDMSVGYGGRPDKDGHVTLDASIMDENGNCGSVCFLQHKGQIGRAHV